MKPTSSRLAAIYAVLQHISWLKTMKNRGSSYELFSTMMAAGVMLRGVRIRNADYKRLVVEAVSLGVQIDGHPAPKKEREHTKVFKRKHLRGNDDEDDDGEGDQPIPTDRVH